MKATTRKKPAPSVLELALMELARTVTELRRDLAKVKAEVKILVDERDLRRRIR